MENTMKTNSPRHSNNTQETQKKYPVHNYIKILAYTELIAGVLLSFHWDGGVIFFTCLIGAFASFVFTLGFAKIVEAADKYIKQ